MNSPSNDNNSTGNKKTAESCPLCEASAAEAYAPFCSKRCADVDLHRWLNGNYAIPAVDDDSDGVLGEPGEG